MATINNPYYIFQTYGTNYTQIPLNFILTIILQATLLPGELVLI